MPDGSPSWHRPSKPSTQQAVGSTDGSHADGRDPRGVPPVGVVQREGRSIADINDLLAPVGSVPRT